MTLRHALRAALPNLVFAAAMVAGLALAGCISLFPKTPPVTLYRFETQTEPADRTAMRAVSIQRASGSFTSASAGDRILTINGSQAAYIAGARWVSSASSLFDDAVTRTLQSAPAVRLASVGDIGRPDYVLRIDVTTFEARYLNGAEAAPTVVVQARASLSNTDTRASAGTILLEAQVPATENRVSAIVTAYGAATTQVMGQLKNWLTQRIGA
jgi:cholesterol transport system auxiliary component